VIGNRVPNWAAEESRTRVVRYEISLRSLFTIAALVLGIWLLARLWTVLLLILIALILAGTLSPILTWLERHHVRRPVGLALVLVGLIFAVVGLGALVVPALAAQVAAVVESGPALRNQAADYMASLPLLAERAESVRNA